MDYFIRGEELDAVINMIKFESRNTNVDVMLPETGGMLSKDLLRIVLKAWKNADEYKNLQFVLDASVGGTLKISADYVTVEISLINMPGISGEVVCGFEMTLYVDHGKGLNSNYLYIGRESSPIIALDKSIKAVQFFDSSYRDFHEMMPPTDKDKLQ